MIKIIKRIKDFSYRERIEKFGLTILLEWRMKWDLIGTFKMINGISNYGRYFFNISLWTGNLLQISKTKSTHELDFTANRIIYFWNKITSSDQKQQ